MSKENLREYEELGYKRRVEVTYHKNVDATTINEYVYDPNEEDETDREIDNWYITSYPGKPNTEKTKHKYILAKHLYWNEEVNEEDIEFVEWVPPETIIYEPEEHDDLLDELDFL